MQDEEQISALRAPTSKERKYDRQLRLWAASGQEALENAHVLLINSGAGIVGTEILKNIVLPGIGCFTILDPAVVTDADLGANFFLEEADLGKSRAEATCRLLSELNPDVKGHYISETFETRFSTMNELSGYSIVIAVLPIASGTIERLTDYSTKTNNALFLVHSIGFYARFSLQLPHAFPIMDTHPDPATISDLRLLEPWDELVELMKQETRELPDMDDEAHGHVPYVLLLLYYLEKWKENHDGKPPQTYKEKIEFRRFVQEGARTGNAEGGEENYDEATGNIVKTINRHKASSAVREIFEAPECVTLTDDSPSFWVIANAVRHFYTSHGVLPCSGSIPDMKAKSADYVRLQNVYKAKARADVAEVVSLVRQFEQDRSRASNRERISEKEIELFAKNSGHIKLIRGHKPFIFYPGRMVEWGARARWAVGELSNQTSLTLLYLAFLAYEAYMAVNDISKSSKAATFTLSSERINGSVNKDGVSVVTALAYSLIEDLIKSADAALEDSVQSEVQERLNEIVQELIRADGGELHNVSAVVGGMVAQEVIKIITKQYVPVDNICIFDGIRSMTDVFRL